MHQITNDFRFYLLVHLQLDPVAQRIVLDSVRNAIPSTGGTSAASCDRSATFPWPSISNRPTWILKTSMPGTTAGPNAPSRQLPTVVPGPEEAKLLRAIGRLCHVDDDERIAVYRSLVAADERPDLGELDERALRWLRMLVGSLTTLSPSAALTQAVDQFVGAPAGCVPNWSSF